MWRKGQTQQNQTKNCVFCVLKDLSIYCNFDYSNKNYTKYLPLLGLWFESMIEYVGSSPTISTK